MSKRNARESGFNVEEVKESKITKTIDDLDDYTKWQILDYLDVKTVLTCCLLNKR